MTETTRRYRDDTLVLDTTMGGRTPLHSFESHGMGGFRQSGQGGGILGTVAAIERELMHDGFVLRYLPDAEVDGLPGSEGCFLPCSFWLADNYALQGRKDEAHALFNRRLGVGNDARGPGASPLVRQAPWLDRVTTERVAHHGEQLVRIVAVALAGEPLHQCRGDHWCRYPGVDGLTHRPTALS